MRYDIHHAEINTAGKLHGDGGTKRVGVEIRPPLDPEAAQGILEELLLERDYGYAALVAANITRQDNEGTVYTGVVKSNEYRGLTNSESMAHFIGKTIDPCGLHVIEYHGPDE